MSESLPGDASGESQARANAAREAELLQEQFQRNLA